MVASSLVTLEHWVVGALAGLLWIVLLAIGVARRPAVPRAALVLAALGGMLLALAAGGAALLRPAVRPVAVMVDLSPSTRGAAYRDDATLQQRLRELLGDTPHEVHRFGENALRTTLPEVADAPAVVLFSDGRLTARDDLPPTFCVIDSNLEAVHDAAITALDVRGNAAGAAIGVRVRGAQAERPLALEGVEGQRVVAIPRGSLVIARATAAGATSVSATFAPGDAWPENDSLAAPVPPPPRAERWWVGGRGETSSTPPDDTWRRFAPNQLPTDPAPFLAASVVVLDNVPVDALDDTRRDAIQRYVRDLGGALLILGGDASFAAGGYAGTVLDDLSPLASTPPEPTTRWVLLADASGSMNQPARANGDRRTRWSYAADAVASLVPQLPPADAVDVGSFAADVRWWSRGKSAKETSQLTLPPGDVVPRGATNLDAALRSIAGNLDDKLPTHVLVATDAQASIERPTELAAQLKARQAKLHVLLIGDGNDADGAQGLAALKSIVAETGGTLRPERLAENWAAGLRELFRATRPAHVRRDPVNVRFVGELALLPPADVSLWNQTWPKDRATALAEAEQAGSCITFAARWNVGAGHVVAAAFTPRSVVTESLVRLVERRPRDPRFSVNWEARSTLRVAVDAVDNGTYLNGENLTLELLGDVGADSPQSYLLKQTAPGRYEVSIDAPRRAASATLRRANQALDVIAVPARYPAEFDDVGADRAALAELARRTGGAVIEPGVTRRLDLPWPRRRVSLVSFLATLGAALVAGALVRWRMGS